MSRAQGRGRPAREWWLEERERVLTGGLIDPVKASYAESMKFSANFAAEYRGFWDLPEDFAFEIETPGCAVDRPLPGKVTPEEAADRHFASPEGRPVDLGDGLRVAAGPDGKPVIRCHCGYELCAATRNWKMEALIEVHDDGGELEWVEQREYHCPGCVRRLGGETLPPGYPVVHELSRDDAAAERPAAVEARG